jgi:hypothetical protein
VAVEAVKIDRHLVIRVDEKWMIDVCTFRNRNLDHKARRRSIFARWLTFCKSAPLRVAREKCEGKRPREAV